VGVDKACRVPDFVSIPKTLHDAYELRGIFGRSHLNYDLFGSRIGAGEDFAPRCAAPAPPPSCPGIA